MLIMPTTASAAWKHGMQIRNGGNIGLGIGQGTLANGLSLKYFADSSFAIQGNLGYWRSWGGFRDCRNDYCRYYGGNSFALSVDALFEQETLAGNQNVELAWNFGVGGGLGVSEYNDTVGAAVAGILGLEVLINAIPIDIVLEWRPSALIAPGFYLDLVHFTGHIRFYF
jgi:hypothetical protein